MLFKKQKNGSNKELYIDKGLISEKKQRISRNISTINDGKDVILCVAEKNSVSKEISSFLCPQWTSPINLISKSKTNPVLAFPYTFFGKECNMVVTSVRGHIKNLEFEPKFSNWNTVDPAILLDLSTPVVNSVVPDCSDIADNLKFYAKVSKYLILWLDCDREGENIAFEVISICMTSNQNLKIFRAHFSALTKNDILNAIENLRAPDRALSDSVEARREIDLRVGSSFTRFLTLRYKKIFPIPEQTLSYGTCQFPTLGFVVNRYNKMINFIRESEWTIILNINLNIQKNNLNTNKLKFDWERGKLFDRLFVFIIYEICLEDQRLFITNISKKDSKKHKPLPLNTVEMTKIASKKLKLSPHKCLKIAEELYQKGFISYPRTETNFFSKNIDLIKYVGELSQNSVFGNYATELIDLNRFMEPRKGNKDDGSHPPIHPVKNLEKNNAASSDEWLLYELISRHFLATCSKDAVLLETNATACISDEIFHTKGVELIEMNWLDIYSPYEKVAIKRLPELELGELIAPFELVIQEGSTEPPSLLSESELIDLMDKNGIGTDATMHEHIERIHSRQYVRKDRKMLLSPTALGYALFNGFELISDQMKNYRKMDKISREFDFLNNSFCHSLMHFHIRQMIENSVSRISKGECTRSHIVEGVVAFMRHIYTFMLEYIEKLDLSLSSFFPKWDYSLVKENGSLIQRRISECGFCRSSIDLFEIKRTSSGLPPLSEKGREKVYISREVRMGVCTGQKHNKCKIPLNIPTLGKIDISNIRCQYCKFNVLKIHNVNTKRVHYTCPYCINFSYSCYQYQKLQ
ncbi:DNA topoisomerase III [Cryptosporidium bovis]|uniref:DNA topoisomerase III n=1 Tax=Cryptosporidium bovis TaxID=310047 RepID=UPI003519F444|nr:DNA topoisomerase III [Cryptosporidium bovis]